MEIFVKTLGPVLGSREAEAHLSDFSLPKQLPLPKPMRKGPPSGNRHLIHGLVGHITY